MTVKTGPLASGGLDMERALIMYLRERNYTLAGRKVTLSVGDSAGVPAQARTKLQELVEKDRIQVLIGPLAAAEALASDDYIRSQQLPTLSVAAAEDLTQRKPNPWFVRATSTSSQCAQPMADYCAKTLKYRRMAVIADDFAYGHEMCAGLPARVRGRGRQDRAEDVPAAHGARLRAPTWRSSSRTSTPSSSASPARTASGTSGSSTSTACAARSTWSAG